MMPPLDVFPIRNNETTWLGPAETGVTNPSATVHDPGCVARNLEAIKPD